MFNEIDGDFDNVAIRTFKVGLPTKHGLRKYLNGKPVTNVSSSWFGLISIIGLRRNNSKARERIGYHSGKKGFQVGPL